MVEVIRAVDKIDTIKKGDKLSDHIYVLYDAQRRLEDAFTQSVYRPFLRVSREKAGDLAAILEKLTQKAADGDSDIDDLEFWILTDGKNKFETIFIAEISTLPAYLVLPKENYDIDALIDAGFGLFPPSMLKKVPETFEDAQEVGRCLAFERYTACGFHTFRVVESVVRRYWDQESSGKKRPHPETLGNIAGQLECCRFGSEKVFEALKQMSKLHRNPIAHPEVILTSDEAGGAIGMARSVIAAMLISLPEVPPTTGALPAS